MTYKHLSPEDRHYIEVSLKNKASHSAIATSLGRSQGTISREITRNTGKKGYRHKQAQRTTKERHQSKKKAVKITDEIKLIIDDLITQDWSPEQVCGWLKKENIVELHHETIYQYILADVIFLIMYHLPSSLQIELVFMRLVFRCCFIEEIMKEKLG